MQHLSHEAARGKWTELATHWGVREGRWVGCCHGTTQDAFCTLYTSWLPPAEEALRAAERKAVQGLAVEAKDRVRDGMPPALAAGETKLRRQLLSHTGSVCAGLPKCKACKGAFENNVWTCCKAARSGMWCTLYTGPKV
jgi:hypothetical protein